MLGKSMRRRLQRVFDPPRRYQSCYSAPPSAGDLLTSAICNRIMTRSDGICVAEPRLQSMRWLIMDKVMVEEGIITMVRRRPGNDCG